MKSVAKTIRKPHGFTIVELLTVMSIIVVLIGLLVPALNRVKQFAMTVKQKAQFHSMEAAIELFNNEFEEYPPSDAFDETGASYCGAMKLCEAMMGRDLLGYHPNSVFRQDGLDRSGNFQIYQPNPDNLKARKGPYLPLESANAIPLSDIYMASKINSSNFTPDLYVLCDVFKKTRDTGEKVGMPVLYYKANSSGTLHDPNSGGLPMPTDNRSFIYNYWDNLELLELGKPGATGSGPNTSHKLSDVQWFYACTRSDKIKNPPRPYRADTYILISAGFDGEYGTADDVYNFEWKSKPAQ